MWNIFSLISMSSWHYERIKNHTHKQSNIQIYKLTSKQSKKKNSEIANYSTFQFLCIHLIPFHSIMWFCTWMGNRSGMSISADSPSDMALNRGPLALLLRRHYEFSFGIDIVQFSFFFSIS